VPPGPRRMLVEALHALYRGAGKPSMRRIAKAATDGPFRDTVSHETVSAVLNGKGGLPRWEKVDAVVRVLAGWNVPPADPDDEARRIQQLWHAAQDELPAAGTADPAAPPGDEAVGSGSGWQPRRWGRRRPAAAASIAAAVAAVLAATAAIAAMGAWPSHPAGRQPRRPGPGAAEHAQHRAPAPPGTIQIQAASLSPPLAGSLARNGTAAASVTGFLLRNAAVSGGLCLAADTGGLGAGRNGDTVEVRKCSQAPSEIWIPVQWERSGRKLTWLANDEYQSKCLNADNIGGLANGHRVQLWDCYNSRNEYWDFGDWHDRAKPEANPYPIILGSGNLCLDADKYQISRAMADPVHIWNYYGPPNQLWH
jgi:hypothetical protein